MKTNEITELRAILQSEIQQSLGYLGGELSYSRQKALDFYLGEKFGNEVDGRSSVVTHDVYATVEWILPSLIKPFVSGKTCCEVEPQSEDDVQTAQQAEIVLQYIFSKDNPGFMNLLTMFKDSLIQKNGVLKTWWDERIEEEREEYEGLTEEEYTVLLMEDGVEPLEHTERTEITALETPMGMIEQEITLHDLVIKRTTKTGKIVTVPVPPEEFLINRQAVDIHSARFVAHRKRTTVDELIREGFDKEQVMHLSTGDDTDQFNEERVNRWSMDDEWPFEHEGADDSQQVVWVYETYIKVDMNQDGISEMVKVNVAGEGYEILKRDGQYDIEEVNEHPFDSVAAVPVPHKYYGLSQYDILGDLQLIKSTILRQVLDNLYANNNQRTVVTTDKNGEPLANLDDLLDTEPGGVVREYEAGAVRPLQTAQLPAHVFPLLDWLDNERDGRSGVNEISKGLDSDAISKSTAAAVNQAMSAALAKIELMARIFAETGVKDLFRRYYKLFVRHQDKERIMRLNGEFVPVDPRAWNSKMDVTINVGIGHGNEQAKAVLLANLVEQQKELLQMGMPVVTPENLYETSKELTETAGLMNSDKYWTNPQVIAQRQAQQAAMQPPQQDPNDKLIMAQVKINELQQQVKVLSEQQENQTKMAIAAMQDDTKRREAVMDHQEKMTELELRYQQDVPGSAV